MAGSGAIWRATTAQGGTEAAALSANKIEFSTGAAVPDARGKMTSSNVHFMRDVSIHPHPKRNLNRVQDGLLGIKEVSVVGYFTEPDSAGGIANLNNWMIAAAIVDTTFPEGRFGLRIDDMGQFDLTPSVGTGYLLYDVFIDRIEGSPNEASFICKLYLNGAVI